VLIRAGVPRIVQGLGVAYAATMAIVIVGTANHWVLDAIVGWVVVLIAFGVSVAFERKGPALGRNDYALAADDPND
jgi:uncharacterized membrane protein